MTDDWRCEALGDLVTVKPGKYLPKSDYVDDGQYWIYGSNSVMGRYDKASIEEPHVVMAAVGAYAGAVRFSNEPSWVNNNAFALVPNPEVDPFYLYLWLADVLELPRVLAGTGQPYVKRPSLLAQKVFLPPLPAQRRIVDLMAHLDEHLERLRRELDSIGQLQRAARRHFWRRHESDAVPLETVLVGITAGRSPNTSGERPRAGAPAVLKVNSVDPSGRFFPEEAKELPESHEMSPNWELRGGEVLVTRANTAERVAAVALVPASVPRGLYLCDKTLRLDLDHSLVTPRFLTEMLLATQAREQVAMMATGVGSSMVNISQSKLRSWRVPVPSHDVQQEIAAMFEALSAEASALESEVQALQITRSVVLSELLGGNCMLPESYFSQLRDESS